MRPFLVRRPMDDIEFVHKVNVIGPLRVSQVMLPLLKKGNKKVVSTHGLPACPLLPRAAFADHACTHSCIWLVPCYGGRLACCNLP